VERPTSVPETAEYFEAWDEWGVGARLDGEMHGPWRLWRGDGTYVEESGWIAGGVTAPSAGSTTTGR
jgi:hypothetical protein